MRWPQETTTKERNDLLHCKNNLLKVIQKNFNAIDQGKVTIVKNEEGNSEELKKKSNHSL
jgi:hypothetical protein